MIHGYVLMLIEYMERGIVLTLDEQKVRWQQYMFELNMLLLGTRCTV